MGGSEMGAVEREEKQWDRANRASIGSFQSTSLLASHHIAAFVETTKVGQHPVGYRLILEGLSGPYKNVSCTVEKTFDGLEISNSRMFGALHKHVQKTLTIAAEAGYAGMVRGWNSGIEAGYAQGRGVGVLVEKDRASEARAASGRASRQLHDQIAQEARDTGRSAADVRDEHMQRLIAERKTGVKKGQEK